MAAQKAANKAVGEVDKLDEDHVDGETTGSQVLRPNIRASLGLMVRSLAIVRFVSKMPLPAPQQG